MSPNDQRLLNVLEKILLIDESQYGDELGPDEIDTWDSLASVSIAAGVEEEFGYRLSPEQMAMLECIGDIKAALRSGGVEI